VEEEIWVGFRDAMSSEKELRPLVASTDGVQQASAEVSFTLI
jgi:hypothetical protein